jgi:universal stress protein E
MELNKLLVVHDPTRDEQPALDRAAHIAAETGASLHLFGCIYGDISGADSKAEEVRRQLGEHKEKLDACLAPIIANGVTASSEVEWDRDWYHAVVRAAARNHADMVFKSSFRHSSPRRILKSTSDWTLIRQCLCPVLLVKNATPVEIPIILAGIDISARTEPYEKLNKQILAFSRRLVENERAEVHVVNAFPDFRLKPDRKKLSELSGLDSSRIHIKLGPPEKVIVNTAKALNASLVVVGNSHRSGLAAMMHGNTAEKILDKLDCNILAMP